MSLQELEEKYKSFISQNQDTNNKIGKIKLEISSLEKEISTLKQEKERNYIDYIEQFKQLDKYTIFDVDITGNTIAKLLSVFESVEYSYNTFKITGKQQEFDLDPYSHSYNYHKVETPIKMIIQSPYVALLGESFGIKKFREYLSLNEPTIIIDRNEDKPLNQIDLYSHELKLNLNTPFFNKYRIHYFEMPSISEKHYIIIKNFFDYVVDYRIETQKEEITKEEIDELLENYISEKQKSKTKKLKK